MSKFDLLDVIGETPERYIAEAMESKRGRKTVSFKRIVLIAAAVIMAMALVGCGVVYLLKMQDLKLGDQQVTQERWDEKNQTMTYETVSQQVLTFSGLKGTPNYEAAKEWYEFKKTYDPDYTIYNEQRDAGTLDWGPAEYSLYNSYTQEMRDKVDEINQQYGLKLRGKKVNALNADSLYAYLGMDGVLLPGAKAETDDFNAAFYDGGWFHTDMHMTLTDSPDWPYQFLCSLYYNPKECFDTTVCELNDTADWQEWNYTTKAGDNVLVIRSPSTWYSWVFCDRPDATITLRIETIREVYTDEHGYQEVIKTPMTDDQLKEVLDCIDFSIKPQPGDVSLLEGPAASRELTQTSNGYTVTVKEVFTDGVIARIHLGITAPEDVNLEQYMDEFGTGGANFEHVQFVPLEEIDYLGGWSHGSRADGDGKANTMDYIIEVSESVGKEGISYKEGSTWKLYLENLAAKEWDRENFQWETIWEMEGSWNFEITMDNGDWREVEFISQPITTIGSTGWDAKGNDIFEDVTITSLKLRALGGNYYGDWDLGQPVIYDVRNDKFPTLTLKDGSTIQLINGLEPYRKAGDEYQRIPLDEIETLTLIDGTVLTPVSTVIPVSNPQQTQSGYTLELKSAVTDGRTARIILGVTAPEGTVLSRKDGIYDMFGAVSTNFGGHTILIPEDGRNIRDYGISEYMRGLEDGDGKENTVDILFITEVYTPQNGAPEIFFEPGSKWTVHLEGITMDRAEYPEKELSQIVPLFSNEDTWDLPFTFDEATDTREIEFLTEPMPIRARMGGSRDPLRDLTMESFRLSALQLRVVWKDDWAGNLFEYVGEVCKFVTVVMKDGTRIPLDGSGDYTIPDYVNPIDLDEVDFVELIDGTKLYPQR